MNQVSSPYCHNVNIKRFYIQRMSLNNNLWLFVFFRVVLTLLTIKSPDSFKSISSITLKKKKIFKMNLMRYLIASCVITCVYPDHRQPSVKMSGPYLVFTMNIINELNLEIIARSFDGYIYMIKGVRQKPETKTFPTNNG